MVSSPNHNGVVLIGGFITGRNHYTLNGVTKDILELRTDGPMGWVGSWKVLPQKLKSPRYAHEVIPVPNEMTSCN